MCPRFTAPHRPARTRMPPIVHGLTTQLQTITHLPPWLAAAGMAWCLIFRYGRTIWSPIRGHVSPVHYRSCHANSISWFHWCLVLYRRHSRKSASAFFSVRQNAGNHTIAGVGFIRTGGRRDQSWHPNDFDWRSFWYGADGDVSSCGQNTGMPAFDSGLV